MKYLNLSSYKMPSTIKDTPNQREVRKTTCDLEGKNKEKLLNCPDHYFLVLTKTGYNERSKTFLGVPLTSNKGGNNKENYFRVNYVVDITNADIDGSYPLLTKETLILCDRPCRVDKNDILNKFYCEHKLNEKKFEEIIENINRFIKEGKIK